MIENNSELLVCAVCEEIEKQKPQERFKEMVDFCKALEEAVKERKPLTLFGVDYDPADD